MIYIELTKSDFVHEFVRCDRKDQFSYEAREALYDYYSEIGEDFEMDAIAICCDWQEHDYEDIESVYDCTIDELEADTTVIRLTNSALVLEF